VLRDDADGATSVQSANTDAGIEIAKKSEKAVALLTGASGSFLGRVFGKTSWHW
jgi:hypothetical protein